VTIDDFITRVVNAHNATVYAISQADERYNAEADEFPGAVIALREFAADAANWIAMGINSKTAASIPESVIAPTPDYVVENGLRWRPTADYRLKEIALGYQLQRLWMCCDVPTIAPQWRLVP
jgi:hypothetical protein